MVDSKVEPNSCCVMAGEVGEISLPGKVDQYPLVRKDHKIGLL